MRRTIHPPPLRPGDVVAVVAPAGPVDPRKLERGLSALAAAGYLPELCDGALEADGYLAGADARRAARLEWALRLPEGRAVMAARGGYGTTRLLPLVDWRRFARRPRLVVGYSDISAILSFSATRLGVPAIHGPMPAADLVSRPDAAALDAFVRLAAGQVRPSEPWGLPCVRARGGAAEGLLAGGCLSIVAALLGTPFEPDLSGALLFLEDVDEPCYRLDRMLTQLIQSGRLRRVAGIVVGKMSPAGSETEEDVVRVFAAAGKALSVPVWYGFPAGHTGPNYPLPFGVPARIDARGRMRILGRPVSAR